MGDTKYTLRKSGYYCRHQYLMIGKLEKEKKNVGGKLSNK